MRLRLVRKCYKAIGLQSNFDRSGWICYLNRDCTLWFGCWSMSAQRSSAYEVGHLHRFGIQFSWRSRRSSRVYWDISDVGCWYCFYGCIYGCDNPAVIVIVLDAIVIVHVAFVIVYVAAIVSKLTVVHHLKCAVFAVCKCCPRIECVECEELLR